MQNQQQLLINLFIKDTLKDKYISYRLINYKDLDLIIEAIQKEITITNIQIIQKLITDTSYKSPLLCSDLICYYYSNNLFTKHYFNLFFIFQNIYQFFKKYPSIILSTYCTAVISVCNNNFYEWNYNIKYSIIWNGNKNNNNNLFYNLKLIFVNLHKLYNQFSYDDRQSIDIPDFLFFLNQFYVVDLNLSNEKRKFFINIAVNTLIKFYQARLKIAIEYDMLWDITQKEWTVLFDKVFSNWNLLYLRHKLFFKKNGQQILEMIYNAQKLAGGRIVLTDKNKNLFLQLLEKLN